MDFYSLKLFLSLSETLHFGKSSSLCHISPSALSRQIQRMEEEFGEALFVRNNRSVRLTPAGEMVREYARQMLKLHNSLEDGLRQNREHLTGELKLYASVTACYTILPPLLSDFRRQYPGVHIHLETGAAADGMKKVVEGEVDVTVVARPESLPRGALFKEITDTPLIFVAPSKDCTFREELEKKRISWSKIPLILPESGLARDRADSWFRGKKVTPLIYAEVAGNEAILAMVGLGFGVGVVPELVWRMSPMQDLVKMLEVNPGLKPFNVGICIREKDLSLRCVKAFWDIAQGE